MKKVVWNVPICWFFQVSPSTSTASLTFSGSLASPALMNTNNSNSLILTTAASPSASNNQQYHSSGGISALPSSITHHGKNFHVEREREMRDRILNGQVGKAKVAAAELRAAQANNGSVFDFSSVCDIND